MAAVKGGRLATDDGALEQPEPTDARDVQAKKEEDVQGAPWLACDIVLRNYVNIRSGCIVSIVLLV